MECYSLIVKISQDHQLLWELKLVYILVHLSLASCDKFFQEKLFRLFVKGLNLVNHSFQKSLSKKLYNYPDKTSLISFLLRSLFIQESLNLTKMEQFQNTVTLFSYLILQKKILFCQSLWRLLLSNFCWNLSRNLTYFH